MAGRQEQPELAQEDIPRQFYSVPVKEGLGFKTRNTIAKYLNPRREVVATWEDLAEIMGFNYLAIENFFLSRSPTKEILSEWSCSEEVSIGDLANLLIVLGRRDLLQPVFLCMEKDVNSYLLKKERSRPPVQVNNVTTSERSLAGYDAHLLQTDSVSSAERLVLKQDPSTATGQPDAQVNLNEDTGTILTNTYLQPEISQRLSGILNPRDTQGSAIGQNYIDCAAATLDPATPIDFSSPDEFTPLPLVPHSVRQVPDGMDCPELPGRSTRVGLLPSLSNESIQEDSKPLTQIGMSQQPQSPVLMESSSEASFESGTTCSAGQSGKNKGGSSRITKFIKKAWQKKTK